MAWTRLDPGAVKASQGYDGQLVIDCPRCEPRVVRGRPQAVEVAVGFFNYGYDDKPVASYGPEACGGCGTVFRATTVIEMLEGDE